MRSCKRTGSGKGEGRFLSDHFCTLYVHTPGIGRAVIEWALGWLDSAVLPFEKPHNARRDPGRCMQQRTGFPP